jgi:hypothetical protein
MPRRVPGRLHLLPARAAPVVAILRRKPTDWSHVIRWNVSTDELTHGPWFQGKFYPLRCDVSFDGHWMVYLLMGEKAHTWSGICQFPKLSRVCDAEGNGSWFGGGYWSTENVLMCNGWEPSTWPEELPFVASVYSTQHGEDEGVLNPRLERDGWRRVGPFGPERKVEDARSYTVVCENDPGWFWRPTPQHPTLRMFFRGYFGGGRGRVYEFAIDKHPRLLDATIDWATWDSLGQLIVARRGGVERYTLADLARGVPTFQHSFEDLESPPVEYSLDP